MGSQTRIQAYKYSSKVAGVTDRVVQTLGDGVNLKNSDGSFIPFQIGLMLVNPLDLITLEGLVTHFRASSITVGAAVTGVGVCYNQANINKTPDKLVAMSVAQSGGVIDFTKSLTGLINPATDNIVMIQFDRDTTMTVEMWKNDMLYTVIGVK